MTTTTTYTVDIYLHPLPDRLIGTQKVTVSSSKQPTTFSDLASLVNTALSTQQKHCLDWNLVDSPVIYGRVQCPNGEIGQVFLPETRHLQEFLTRPLGIPAISFCKSRIIPLSPISSPSSVSTPTRLRVRVYLHRLEDHAIGVHTTPTATFARPMTFSQLIDFVGLTLSKAEHSIDWKLAHSPHIYGHTEGPDVEISKVPLRSNKDLLKFLERPSETHCISFCRWAPIPLLPLEASSSTMIQVADSGTVADPTSVNGPSSASKPLARKRGLSTSDEDGANHKRGSGSLRIQREGPDWRILSVGHPDDADWAKKSMKPTAEFLNQPFVVPLRSFIVDRSPLLQAMENPVLRSLSQDRMVITHFDADWLNYASSMIAVFNDTNAAKAHDEMFGDMIISKSPDVLHSQYLILEMDLATLASHLRGPSDLLNELTELVIETLTVFCDKYHSRLRFAWQSIYREGRLLHNVIRDFMIAFEHSGVEDEIFLILKNYDHAINAAFLNSRCNQDRFDEHAVIELLCTYFFDPISKAKDNGIIKRMVCFGRSHAARLALASRFRLYDGASHESISPLMYATEIELRESMEFLYADIPPELLAERVEEAEFWIAGQSDRPAGREPGNPHYVEWGLMYKILRCVFRQRRQPEQSIIGAVNNFPVDCFSLKELQLFGIAISQSPPKFLLERLPPLSEHISEQRTEVWDCPCPNVLLQYTDVLTLPESNDVVVARLNLSPLDSEVAIFKLLYEAGLLTLANNNLDEELLPSNDVYLRLPNLHARNLVIPILETYARYDFTMQGYAGTEWLKSSVINFMRVRNIRALKDFKEATLQTAVVSMLTIGGALVGRIPLQAVLDELQLYDERCNDRFCDLFLPTLRVVIELKNINILDLFKGIYGRPPANDDELELFVKKYLFEVDIPSDADFDDDSKSVTHNPPTSFKAFGDSLTWADLWYEVKKNDGTIENLCVDTCFRLGIRQLRGYQSNIARGRFPMWRRSKITTISAPTQMVKATLLMLLGGRFVITKDLEDIPTNYEFRLEL